MTTPSSREDGHACHQRRHGGCPGNGDESLAVKQNRNATPRRRASGESAKVHRRFKRKKTSRDTAVVKMYFALVVVCGYGWLQCNSHHQNLMMRDGVGPLLDRLHFGLRRSRVNDEASLYEQALQEAKEKQSGRSAKTHQEPTTRRRGLGDSHKAGDYQQQHDRGLLTDQSTGGVNHSDNIRNNMEGPGTTDKVAITTPSSPDYRDLKFLVFDISMLPGQGEGNLMNGLLATHLLAEEFDRIVCVSPQYKSFHLAFVAIDPLAARHCPTLFKRHPVDNVEPKDQMMHGKLLIPIINYQSPPDECKLQQQLADKQKVWYVSANTYPRWRKTPPGFFHKFYRPTTALTEVLPPGPPPEIVVHLRKEDGRSDERRGLDEASLNALGELLSTVSSSKPYLVTNNVLWYDRFKKRGWSHPPWQSVEHSALKGQKWGSLVPEAVVRGNAPTEKDLKRMQLLQLWSDWYTILMAKRVYHTHSDFSLSAIHWMGSCDKEYGENGSSMTIWSRTIHGMDSATNQLQLVEESWVREEEMPKLVGRTGDQLKHCKGGTQTKIAMPDAVEWYDDDDSHHPEDPEAKAKKTRSIQVAAMSAAETRSFYKRAFLKQATQNESIEANEANGHSDEKDFENEMQQAMDLLNSQTHKRYTAYVAGLFSKAAQLKHQRDHPAS